ncbi:MAG: signal peptide peptidase SppA [Rickettsiaceae bacterium]|nr:signal peptide peptidase SppA [Rickettsiaceae bacterium]
MTISPDYLIERNHHKKSITRWKLFSLVLLLVVISFLGFGNPGGNFKNFFQSSNAISNKEGYIARIKIHDVILDDIPRLERIQSLIDDNNVKAIIVSINSPGGNVVGSEMLYNKFKKASQQKPVVAVLESLATSGGYLAALGTNYIVAHNGTITGSIGVIIQTTEITELAKAIGIRFENFKSNPIKSLPNMTEKTSEEARESVMEVVRNTHEYFIEQVSISRHIPKEQVRIIADGKIFSGKQAVQLGLVDIIGSYEDAANWLHSQKNISKKLEIVDIELKSKEKLIDLLLDGMQNKINNMFSIPSNSIKLIMN